MRNCGGPAGKNSSQGWSGITRDARAGTAIRGSGAHRITGRCGDDDTGHAAARRRRSNRASRGGFASGLKSITNRREMAELKAYFPAKLTALSQPIQQSKAEKTFSKR